MGFYASASVECGFVKRPDMYFLAKVSSVLKMYRRVKILDLTWAASNDTVIFPTNEFFNNYVDLTFRGTLRCGRGLSVAGVDV